jgi:hypothetical protein
MTHFAPFEWLENQYSFQQKIMLAVTTAVVTPVAASALAFVSLSLGGFKLLHTQIARVLKASSNANCFDAANSKMLSCESLQLSVLDSGGFVCQVWPGVYSGNLLGLAGQIAIATTDEVIRPQDYIVFGGDGVNFSVEIFADILNHDAALPHSISLAGSALVEIWQETTTSRMRG